MKSIAARYDGRLRQRVDRSSLGALAAGYTEAASAKAVKTRMYRMLGHVFRTFGGTELHRLGRAAVWSEAHILLRPCLSSVPDATSTPRWSAIERSARSCSP